MSFRYMYACRPYIPLCKSALSSKRFSNAACTVITFSSLSLLCSHSLDCCFVFLAPFLLIGQSRTSIPTMAATMTMMLEFILSSIAPNFTRNSLPILFGTPCYRTRSLTPSYRISSGSAFMAITTVCELRGRGPFEAEVRIKGSCGRPALANSSPFSR